MGVKISKRLLQIASKSFETFPEFFSEWSSQNSLGDFWNFESLSFNDFFFQNFKFTIVAYGGIKNLSYLENGVEFGTRG